MKHDEKLEEYKLEIRKLVAGTAASNPIIIDEKKQVMVKLTSLGDGMGRLTVATVTQEPPSQKIYGLVAWALKLILPTLEFGIESSVRLDTTLRKAPGKLHGKKVMYQYRSMTFVMPKRQNS